MSDYRSRILKEAERNDDGDLIWETKLAGPDGTNRTREVNATNLFQRSERRTGNLEILLLEAELAQEGELSGNPAKPATGEVAKTAINKIESQGLEPAWRAVDEVAFP